MKLRLTEIQFKDAIKEIVYDVYKKLPLFEYAYKRKEFVDIVAEKTQQIVSHLCLLRYRTLTNDETTKNHWVQEVFGQVSSIMGNTIKGGNDIEKAILEGFEKADAFDINAVLYKNYITWKFFQEGIDPNSDVAQEALRSVAQEIMPQLVPIMASRDFQRAMEFIQEV